ncbi:hypothetical protein F2Q69_00045681 [Brassica cretica]|uniref:RNase H type-1 domain-containing protein n=1 Tax=Brassica cretica TaxID=69181 RepID=A0A8S9NM90_BRACR|nr:hypothetical protein F2Q69_00045681 [Brassica cretica]
MGPRNWSSVDLKVADLFQAGTKEWNKELIQQLLPNEAPSIFCIKPSTTGAKDTYSWTMTSNGDYSTKSEEWVSSPIMAEALAIREALLQARGHGHINVAIRSDAQILIRAINGRDQIKGLYGILQDIHNLTCYLSTFVFSFISRKDNVAADNLAKKALFNFFNCM